MSIVNKMLTAITISALIVVSANYAYAEGSKGICAQAASDGQFVVPAIINGARISLEVDTGAHDVVLNSKDALALGVLPPISDTKTFITGNGEIRINAIKVNVQVGSMVYPNVSVYLNTNWTGRSVMGISLLSRFAMVSFNKTDMCFIY